MAAAHVIRGRLVSMRGSERLTSFRRTCRSRQRRPDHRARIRWLLQCCVESRLCDWMPDGLKHPTPNDIAPRRMFSRVWSSEYSGSRRPNQRKRSAPPASASTTESSSAELARRWPWRLRARRFGGLEFANVRSELCGDDLVLGRPWRPLVDLGLPSDAGDHVRGHV